MRRRDVAGALSAVLAFGGCAPVGPPAPPPPPPRAVTAAPTAPSEPPPAPDDGVDLVFDFRARPPASEACARAATAAMPLDPDHAELVASRYPLLVYLTEFAVAGTEHHRAVTYDYCFWLTEPAHTPVLVHDARSTRPPGVTGVWSDGTVAFSEDGLEWRDRLVTRDGRELLLPDVVLEGKRGFVVASWDEGLLLKPGTFYDKSHVYFVPRSARGLRVGAAFQVTDGAPPGNEAPRFERAGKTLWWLELGGGAPKQAVLQGLDLASGRRTASITVGRAGEWFPEIAAASADLVALRPASIGGSNPPNVFDAHGGGTLPATLVDRPVAIHGRTAYVLYADAAAGGQGSRVLGAVALDDPQGTHRALVSGLSERPSVVLAPDGLRVWAKGSWLVVPFM